MQTNLLFICGVCWVSIMDNAVQYNKILHTSLQKLKQNINRGRINKRHHTSYGLSFVNIFDKFDCFITAPHCITHWGRVTHICVSKQTIIGSDNGLSPGRRQAIIWTNAGILLIGPLGTNFSEIFIGIQAFFFQENTLENVVCEMASILSRP